MSARERAPRSTQRLPAIDWLRVLAVLAVFFYHVAHIFDFDLQGSMRNAEASLGASVYVFFVHQWAMPLLFLLAGVTSAISLQRRSARSYLQERVQRLLVPLLFGTVVLIPWNGYVSALNHGTFDGSFWAFLPEHARRTWAALALPEVHHGLVALYHTSWHLWFLGYLLIFSAISLAWARRPLAAAGLAAWCERPAGLLALVLPIALVKLTLGARFPAYLDWADTLVYLTVFYYGWLFMTDARLLRAVEAQALRWLAVGCGSFALLLASFAAGYLPEWLARPDYRPDYLAYQLLAAINLWAWVLALVGCGLRWLDVEHAVLGRLGEGVLPFYMLHQVLVLTVAVRVVTWPTGVAIKILAISAIAFAATLAIYELVIRRIGPLRILFGLKTAPPPVRAVASAA